MKAAIILAAGKGVRMKSDLPKVFHKLLGKPLLSHVLDAVDEVGFDKVFVVVGYRADLLRDHYSDRNVIFVEQKEQLGTAHAVMQVAPHLKGVDASVVVLAGDMPLISSKTIAGLIDDRESLGASAVVLAAGVADPFGYGRVVRDAADRVVKIVEEKDATETEKKIKEINTGIYCFDCRALFDAIEEVRAENVQKEYYLTDVISILSSRGKPVFSREALTPLEARGVNSKEQLDRLEAIIGQMAVERK